MQIGESVELAHLNLDEYHNEYLALNKEDSIKYPIQVTDKRSNVFFKFLADKLSNHNEDKTNTAFDRYTINILKYNKRYEKRVNSIQTLKSKAMAIISKDKSEVKNYKVYINE